MVRRKKSAPRRWAQRLETPREQRLNCRIPDQLHSDLMEASARNGWTISAEVVHRLEQSFAVPATPTHAFFSLIAHAVEGLTPPKGLFKNPEDARAKANWWSNPYTYREARRAVECALELIGQLAIPTGELPVGEDPALIEGPLATPNGRLNFQIWWDEVRHYNIKAPIDASRPSRAQQQRQLAMLRAGLKSMPDNIVLWGVTGKQALRQQRQQRLSVAEHKEFRRLARIRIEYGLNERQHQRFRELFEKAPPELKQQLQLGDPFKAADPHDLSDPGPFGKITGPLHTDKLGEDELDEDNDPKVPS